jgi:hypothetical protein
VSVTEILDLGWGRVDQTVIALAQVALLVLSLAVGDAKACQEAHADLTAQINLMTLGVPRCVMDGVYPTMHQLDTKGSHCIGLTDQVATIPPAVPSVTTHAIYTARNAGPPALFAAHARNPGPPGKDPTVIKKIPP